MSNIIDEKSQIKYNEAILDLYNSANVCYNTTTKIVEAFSIGSKFICANITIEEFAKKFIETYDINESQENKIIKFFNNFEPQEGQDINIEISFDVNFERTKMRMRAIGAVKDSKLYISFKNLNVIQSSDKDALTKVLSKKGIIPHFEQAIQDKREFALLILDIDDFYALEESLGKMYSDVILVETAAFIQKYVGNNGYVERIGLDRFLILYYVNDIYDDIHDACENIRQSVINLNNHNVKQCSINATIGCTSFPSNGDDFDTLYRKAYLALQRGIRKGGACFIIYIPERCGTIDTIDEEKFAQFETNIGAVDQMSSYFKIFAGVFEILNRQGSIKKNYNDALSLIGNYYVVDRVSLITFFNDESNNELYTFTDEKAAIKDTIELREPSRKAFIDTFANKDIIKINQVKSNKELPIYPILREERVSSTLVFKLNYTNKAYGFLKFDMFAHNKFWSDSDISSLYLIAQMFTASLYRVRVKEDTEKMLFYDNLTSIYNYSRWRDLVDAKLDEAKDKYDRQNFSIIYFYFEAFMHMNDTLGTAICDNALKYLGKVLIDIDTFKDLKLIYARVSGDKFIIYIPTKDKEIIDELIETISQKHRQSFSYGEQFNLLFGIYINNVAGSFGIRNIDYITNAIDKANIARKKATLVNKVIYFTEELYEQMAFRSELELHMRKALEDGEYLLYLQPKVNSLTNEVVAAEALTRWNYKFQRILTPNYFIPLFENNGFINEFDLNCFRNVCKFQRNCLDKGLHPVPISVNLSMCQKDFTEYRNSINSIRKEYDLPANLFEIEVTESMFIENKNQIIDLLHNLHNDGYSVSMDDFGSGYSNLVSLAKFNFDTIKIDKSFLDNSKGEKEKTILTFVTNLAKDLNINVLCEGVETKELVNFLSSIGCTLIQGYYYDKPIIANEFEEKYLGSDNNNFKKIEGK